MTKEQQNNTLISEIPEISYLSDKILVKMNEVGLTAEKLAKQRYYKFRYKFQPNGTKTF